jgi:hypothetical protein
VAYIERRMIHLTDLTHCMNIRQNICICMCLEMMRSRRVTEKCCKVFLIRRPTFQCCCVRRNRASYYIRMCSELVMDWMYSSGVPRGGLEVQPPPPKFQNFYKAEPNSQVRGKYICNNLIRIRGSLICELSGTPD